jgi:MFS family permease
LNLLVGAAYGLAFPAHTALAMEHARGYGMGTVMSLLMMAHGVGMMIGPLLFGVIAGQLNLNSAFWGGGLITALTIGLCYPLTKAPGSPSQQVPAEKQEPAVAD